MKKIIVTAHGNLAAELINTSRMFTSYDELTSVGLEIGGDLQAFKKNLSNEILENSSNEIFILVDLVGGTPFNTAIQIIHEYEGTKKIEVLTGVNLPMLLELLLAEKELEVSAVKEKVIKTGKEGIKDFSKVINDKKGGE